MHKSSEIRSRQFSVVMYVEKNELDNILNSLRLYHNLKECAYIYHNRDVDENGEPKEKHAHVYLYFINARELKGVYYLLRTYTTTNVLIQVCKNRYVLVNEYFIHKDNPEKVQYNKSEVYVSDKEFFEGKRQEDDRTLLLVQDIVDNVSITTMIKRYGRDYIINKAKYDYIAELVKAEQNKEIIANGLEYKED